MPINSGYTVRDDLKEIIVESPMEEIKFIADTILPPISVKNVSGQIPILSSGAGMKNLDTKKARRGTFKRSDYVYGGDSYNSFHYGYEEPVDEVEALELEDIFDEEIVAAEVAKNQMELAREIRVANTLFSTSTFDSASADQQTAGLAWDDVDCDIWTNVDDAYEKVRSKCGRTKSQLSLIVPEYDFRQGMRSTKVREDVKYTSDITSKPMAVKAQFLADFLGIKEIILADAVVDGQPEGIKDAVFTGVWDVTQALLAYFAPPSNSWRAPGVGRQPVWAKFAKDFKVESYDEKNTASRIVRVREHRGIKVFKKFGCLITGVDD